ncbi:hypothetical protein HanIR_Chr15g0740391 [Helianthus annuus]|nr:hypothetical protein HanIR_Chr15g0740391 [Helianthus annuus]
MFIPDATDLLFKVIIKLYIYLFFNLIYYFTPSLASPILTRDRLAKSSSPSLNISSLVQASYIELA